MSHPAGKEDVFLGQTVSKAQVRRFLLAHHGLQSSFALRTKEDILTYITKVGCIQYDPLNVVGQNADLVLQSRVAGYRSGKLQEMLYQDRTLIDCWDKNMAICPTDSWPYHHPFCQRYLRWCEENAATVEQVRMAIEQRGPLCSGDFDMNEKVSWYYGPTRLARAALEGMYYAGKLVIHHKAGTRKYYDLAERHISRELLAAANPNCTEEDQHAWFVHRRIGSVGLLWNRPSDAWLGNSGFRAADRTRAFAQLTEAGRILPIQVEGVADPLFMRAEEKALFLHMLQEAPAPAEARILAPLDNLLWDRKLISALFDYEYRWEVYKPAAERQYGYYVLPVLYGDRLVARFEPAHYKRKGPVVIKKWWWEAGVIPDEEMLAALDQAFVQFALFLGADGYAGDFAVQP